METVGISFPPIVRSLWARESAKPQRRTRCANNDDHLDEGNRQAVARFGWLNVEHVEGLAAPRDDRLSNSRKHITLRQTPDLNIVQIGGMRKRLFPFGNRKNQSLRHVCAEPVTMPQKLFCFRSAA
jgi:hypothetical protein